MLARGEQARRTARVLALATPTALLGGAYISQYGFGLYPCQMCWWQRYAHFVALVLACLALSRRNDALTWAAALAIGVGGLLGAFHAGVEYHWWEGVTACSSTATLGGDPLEAIMNAPIVRCDVAPWDLLGISLAGWNFLISSAAALTIAVLLRRGRTA
ncbi:MAG TPA: disulfide bond formation protein B [Novosphingobium sp.]|nr:disulfide bond formation protein B [Novosphingobium sp.]